MVKIFSQKTEMSEANRSLQTKLRRRELILKIYKFLKFRFLFFLKKIKTSNEFTINYIVILIN